MKYHTHAIYQRGKNHIQTSAHTDADGTLWAAYSTMTAAEYCDEKNATRAETDPPFEIMLLDEASALIEHVNLQKHVHPWREIEKETWWNALEVLPPEKWQTVAGVEIFRMMEYLTGDITAHYARLGDRYFCANRSIKTPYEKIAAEVFEASQSEPAIA